MSTYNKINWENSPSTATPLTAENLNHMDDGIEAATEAVTALEANVKATNTNLANKANKATTLEGYGITDAIKNTSGSVKSQNIAAKAVTMPKLGDDVAAAIADKADKSEVYSKTEVYSIPETERKLAVKIDNTNGSVHYTNLSNDVFGKIEGGNTKAVRGTDVFTALADKADKAEVETALVDKADKSDVYSKSETNTKLSTKINNADGSVHYTNLAADVFGKIEGGSLGAARGTDVFVGLSKKMDKSEIEQGTAPMTIAGYTKDDFYALNCRYQMVGDYCHITFTANPKVAIDSPLAFSGLPFVAYNTSILGAYTSKNNPVKIEITNDTSNLTITKINGEPFAVGESSTFTIGHRIKE